MVEFQVKVGELKLHMYRAGAIRNFVENGQNIPQWCIILTKEKITEVQKNKLKYDGEHIVSGLKSSDLVGTLAPNLLFGVCYLNLIQIIKIKDTTDTTIRCYIRKKKLDLTSRHLQNYFCLEEFTNCRRRLLSNSYLKPNNRSFFDRLQTSYGDFGNFNERGVLHKIEMYGLANTESPVGKYKQWENVLRVEYDNDMIPHYHYYHKTDPKWNCRSRTIMHNRVKYFLIRKDGETAREAEDADEPNRTVRQGFSFPDGV